MNFTNFLGASIYNLIIKKTLIILKNIDLTYKERSNNEKTSDDRKRDGRS